MERLITYSNRNLRDLKTSFQRYLFQRIDWNQRLILILGHRGSGKTTLMLQKMSMENVSESIYLSLDDFYFEGNRLVELVEDLYQKGYRRFFLDEVHRYAYWSSDLKTLFDQYSDAYFVVSGSSILGVSKGNADLSRRAAQYQLAGMSLREFIHLEKGLEFSKISLDELLQNSQEISTLISDQIDILSVFQQYVVYGYYPFYRQSKELYAGRLIETTHVVLEMDIAPFEDLTHKSVQTMKKLLYIISESVPFIPNVSKLAERLEVSRNTVLKVLDLLHQAQILNLLRSATHGVSFLQKPEKIYLQNPNLAYALSPIAVNQGNIRESFFFNQLQVMHQVSYPKFGDFMVDQGYYFEIGGPNKSAHQILGVPNSYLALDGIKTGNANRIPLWTFGFLY
ncbi:ATP-binding protein [Algoriphagus confluentis]